MRTDKAGNTSIFLSIEDRKRLALSGATVRGCFFIGLQAIEGSLPKIRRLAEKLSEVLQEKAVLEDKLKKTTRELKTLPSETKVGERAHK